MTDKFITDLPAVSTIADTDLLMAEVNPGGVAATSKILWSDVKTLLSGALAPAVHDEITKHSYTGGAALDVFGLSAPNTIARLTPSSNPGAAATILASDASGHLQLVKLGLGMSPTEVLDVAGNAQLSTTFPYLALKPSGWAAACYIQAGVSADAGSGGNFVAFAGTTGKGFSWTENTSVRMVLLPTSGYVGFGTNNPPWFITAQLSSNSGTSTVFPCFHMINSLATKGNGTTTFNVAEYKVSSGNGTVTGGIWTSYDDILQGFMVGSATTDPVGIVIADVPKVWIDTSGQVGIGMLPTKTLEVNGTFSGHDTFYIGPLGGYNAVFFTWSGTNSGQMQILSGGATQIYLNTIGGSYFVGGNLGLGTKMIGAGVTYQQLSILGSQVFVDASSVQEREMALLTPAWVDSTDATRKARLTLSAYDTAVREAIRIEASGSAAMLGFFGHAAAAQPTKAGHNNWAAISDVTAALAAIGLIDAA